MADSAKTPTVEVETGPTDAPVTKGRFKVKHIKSSDSLGIAIAPIAPPASAGGVGSVAGNTSTASANNSAHPSPLQQHSSLVKVPSNDGAASGYESPVVLTPVSAHEEKESKPAAVLKKSRFIVKTKSSKEDDRQTDVPYDGSSQRMPAAAGLVRVPSGTNISLLRQPASSMQQQQVYARPQLRDDQADKIVSMIEQNNRMLRDLLGDQFPYALVHSEPTTPSAHGVAVEHGGAPSPSPELSPHSSVDHSSGAGASVSRGSGSGYYSGHGNAVMGTSSGVGGGIQTSSASSNSSQLSGGDKTFAKLSHHASEIKKEIDNAAQSRRDSYIEIQRLREKCQHMEDRFNQERTRATALEERLEKSQMRQRNMAAQIEALQQALGNGSTGITGGVAVSSTVPTALAEVLPAQLVSVALKPIVATPTAGVPFVLQGANGEQGGVASQAHWQMQSQHSSTGIMAGSGSNKVGVDCTIGAPGGGPQPMYTAVGMTTSQQQIARPPQQMNLSGTSTTAKGFTGGASGFSGYASSSSGVIPPPKGHSNVSSSLGPNNPGVSSAISMSSGNNVAIGGGGGGVGMQQQFPTSSNIISNSYTSTRSKSNS